MSQDFTLCHLNNVFMKSWDIFQVFKPRNQWSVNLMFALDAELQLPNSHRMKYSKPRRAKHPETSCQTLAMFQASNSFCATMLLTVSDTGMSCHTSYIQTVRRRSVASLSAVARARLLWTCSLIGSRKCSLSIRSYTLRDGTVPLVEL